MDALTCCRNRHWLAPKFCEIRARCPKPNDELGLKQESLPLALPFSSINNIAIQPRNKSIITPAPLSPWSVQEQLHRAVSVAAAGCLCSRPWPLGVEQQDYLGQWPQRNTQQIMRPVERNALWTKYRPPWLTLIDSVTLDQSYISSASYWPQGTWDIEADHMCHLQLCN